MRSEADKAISVMQSQVDKVPVAEREQYRRDCADLQFLRWAVEHDRSDGRSSSFDQAFERYGDALVALEQTNLKWKAKIDAAVLEAAIQLVKGMSFATEATSRRITALRLSIEKLKEEIERAKRQVTEAKVQLVLDVAMDTVSLAYPPVAAWEKVLRPAFIAASHMVLDRVLAPGDTTLADLDSLAGAAIEYAPAVSHGAKELKEVGSKLAAVGTGVLDVHDIHEAKEELERIQQRREHVVKELEWLGPEAAKHVPQLRHLREALESAITAKTELQKTAEDADREYLRIRGPNSRR